MSSRVQSYLDKAAHCEALATAATDREARSSFAEVARQWRDLARQVEALETDRVEWARTFQTETLIAASECTPVTTSSKAHSADSFQCQVSSTPRFGLVISLQTGP